MIDWVRKKFFLVKWGAVARRWPLERLLQTIDIDLSDKEKAEMIHGIHSWRYLVPRYMERFDSAAGGKQAYCFGVAHGSTVHGLVEGYESLKSEMPHLHLFDSFEGLPAEDPGIEVPAVWNEGAFAGSRAALEKRLAEIGVSEDARTIHPGWFSETLKPELVADGTFKPAAYVDIDADLYNSTFEVLDFLFTHKLIGPGTLIGYDDWGDTALWTAGESRAHKEIMEKYNVKCAQLYSWGEQPLIRKVFLVVKVGD
ncbi:MAG: TylF/MycF/NovP-related O-methyltransferase [Silicimonas sp.]